MYAEWPLYTQTSSKLDSDDVNRCRVLLRSYLKVVEKTAGDIWHKLQERKSGITDAAASSVAHLRALFASTSFLRQDFYDRVREHANSLKYQDVFFEMLKLNNTTSKVLWTSLYFSALGAETHLKAGKVVEATMAFVVLFDLARHGLYFTFMKTLPSEGPPESANTLDQMWDTYIYEYFAAKGAGRDVTLATHIKLMVRDISTPPNTYEGGACLIPFFVRMSFWESLGAGGLTDPTETSLKNLSDFYLAMVRIPVRALFSADIPNMVYGIKSICDQTQNIVRRGIEDMNAHIRNANAIRNRAYADLRAEHTELSACSVPIATYDRVCDTTWLCCTLTLKRIGNHPATATTQSILESIKAVPYSLRSYSWTAFFRSILNDVYSSYGRQPQVVSSYNEHMDEYILVISSEQLIRKGERRALDKEIATRNVRGTLRISDDHDHLFGESGMRCVRERWAFSHKPLSSEQSGVVLPMVTMGKMLDLVNNAKDCFQSKFGDEIQLLNTLRSEIDETCRELDDPIKSNFFNIQALFVRESGYECVTSLRSGENEAINWTKAIESKLDDANDESKDAATLFLGEDLSQLANEKYFPLVSSYLEQYIKPAYLTRWTRTEVAVINEDYYEWNLRTLKYKDEQRAASLYLNKALTNMVALNTSRELEQAVSPASANIKLAKCISEIRTVYTGIKAAASVLASLVLMLDRQNKIQSKSKRLGRRVAVSDVRDLRNIVAKLFANVFKIDQSLSKQHMRVCDACESLHGRLESSIPEGEQVLISRISTTLVAVKTMLTDEGVLSVLQSIKHVCETLQSSGNLGSHTTKLVRAYDWIPADKVFHFTNLNVITDVVDPIRGAVMNWERVYDKYRDLVVDTFLHVLLSKDEIVSVSIPKLEGVSIASSDTNELDEEMTTAREQAEESLEDTTDVDLGTEMTNLQKLLASYNTPRKNTEQAVFVMSNTIREYKKENEKLGESLHSSEENGFLSQAGPGPTELVATKIAWITRASSIIKPIPGKSSRIANLSNKFNKEYNTFKQSYRLVIETLCNVASKALLVYDNMTRQKNAVFDEIETFMRKLPNTYTRDDLPDAVWDVMSTSLQTMTRRRENLPTDPNPARSETSVNDAVSNADTVMKAAPAMSKARNAWSARRAGWVKKLEFLNSLGGQIYNFMGVSLNEYKWLFGDHGHDTLEKLTNDMFFAVKSTLLKECSRQMQRVETLLHPPS